MFEEERGGELPITVDIREAEKAKEYVIRYLSSAYGDRFRGYLEVEEGGRPGLVAYVDSEKGPLLEFHVLFLSKTTRYLVRVLDPAAPEGVIHRALRVIERCLLSYWETGGKSSIYFVYVPGRRVVPPRMERGIRSALQKLFLGNMVFLFAISIAISYAVYLLVGPYMTPIVLLLSQIPLILASHKVVALMMGDWNIDPAHRKVYLVGLELPQERFDEIMRKVIYPLRYEIKKKIYRETIERTGEVDEGSVRRVLASYGLEVDSFKVNIREIDIYGLVTGIVKEFGIKEPKIYISNTIIPNAAASGVTSRLSTMIITTGLLTRLHDDEIKAVIGHELSHIRRHDVLTFFLLSSIEYVSRVSISLALWPVVISFVDLLILMFYMYLSLTALFFIAKFVEARADLESVKKLNTAHDLASALRKIAMRRLLVEQSRRSRLPFWLSWNPHPPVSFRIEILERIHEGKVSIGNEWIAAMRSCISDFIESLKESLI